MFKSHKALRGFLSNVLRYKKVILKCKIIDKNTIEVLHFHNLGNDGNGKIAMLSLIDYAINLDYKQIKLEVYHYTDKSAKSNINFKLTQYYQELNFVITGIENNNVKMVRYLP